MSDGVEEVDHAAMLENKRRLLQELKQTKGARFNAAARLEERDKSRTRLITYASASVIVVTILPNFLPVPAIVTSLIGLSTVAFSLAILAASLLQSSNADPVRALKLHNCALEVNSLLRELRTEPAADAATLKSYSARYDAILMRAGVNHDRVDFERYKLEHVQEFPDMEPTLQKAAVKEVTDVTIAEKLASAAGAYGAGLAVVAVVASIPEVGKVISWIGGLLAHGG